MGYSSTVRAAFTYEAIQMFSEFNIESESYKFFTEIGKENIDGSITGTVYELIGEPFKDFQNFTRRKCKKRGGFKIDKNGIIIRFPGLSKRLFGVAEIFSVEKYDREFLRKCI